MPKVTFNLHKLNFLDNLTFVENGSETHIAATETPHPVPHPRTTYIATSWWTTTPNKKANDLEKVHRGASFHAASLIGCISCLSWHHWLKPKKTCCTGKLPKLCVIDPCLRPINFMGVASCRCTYFLPNIWKHFLGLACWAERLVAEILIINTKWYSNFRILK